MKIINSLKGEGYVSICVLIIVIVAIFSSVFTYASAISVINVTRENSKVVLDNFVTTNSTLIFNSIKQGNDYTETLDFPEYTEKLCEFCTLDLSADTLYSYDTDGNLQYSMTLPQMSFQKDNQLEICVRYTVSVPIQFAGKTVTTANVPIEIVSILTEKF